MYKDLLLNRYYIKEAIEKFCEENYSEYNIVESGLQTGIRYNINFNVTAK